MHFCTEQGLWILSPITYTETTLGRDHIIVSKNRRDDYSMQKLFQCMTIVLRQNGKSDKLKTVNLSFKVPMV